MGLFKSKDERRIEREMRFDPGCGRLKIDPAAGEVFG